MWKTSYPILPQRFWREAPMWKTAFWAFLFPQFSTGTVLMLPVYRYPEANFREARRAEPFELQSVPAPGKPTQIFNLSAVWSLRDCLFNIDDFEKTPGGRWNRNDFSAVRFLEKKSERRAFGLSRPRLLNTLCSIHYRGDRFSDTCVPDTLVSARTKSCP